MTTIDRRIPLNVLQTGPSRPVYATGPRSLESVRMLRISVTDRCNLRCGYCMPKGGVSFQPKDDLLTPVDLAKISGFAHRLGVRHFKITGGEPTVRGDLLEIIQRIRALGSSDISMTSNGLQMPRLAASLKEAGVDRVTLSVDSLRPDRYRDITGGGRFDVFQKGLEATAEIFGTVKLNVVVMRGVNDDEVADFAGLARERDWTVRFIEFMPLGSSVLADGDPDQYLVTADEVTSSIEAVHGPLDPLDASADPGVGPARLLAMPGGRGRIGLIHAMSRPFCETCNRLRLTSSGILRSCLFDGGEVDLMPILRTGSDDSEIVDDRAFLEAFTRCTAMKPDVHGLRGGRAMSSIGG
ncbi:MAG: GTP 3',8-cyclase MoaA [Phycisphaerales bacterium]|nr:GTP 3',8-cyclase MoaA [Phycisphaerales bacterium]